MAKVHLQGNAGLRREPMAMCSTRLTANGTVVNNNRRSYVGMGSQIMKLGEWKKIPEEHRCAHCCDIYLERRNIIRKEKGLEPVKAYNEKWDETK